MGILPCRLGGIGRGHGLRIEPLLASVALFFPPTIFMGAVSPFAVKLQVKNINLLGSGVGNLEPSASIKGDALFIIELIQSLRTRIYYYRKNTLSPF